MRLPFTALIVAGSMLTGCVDRLPVRRIQLVADADPAAGRALIRSYGCGACHTIPGVTGADALVGPPLVAWSRRAYVAGELPNTPDALVRWLVNPQAVEPGTAMPNLGVTEPQARDIAAYLYTLH